MKGKFLKGLAKKYKPGRYLTGYEDLNLQELKAKGIKLILIDVDNTLLPDNAKHADENARLFCQKIKEQDLALMIFSNGLKERISEVAKELDLPFLAEACKPFDYKLLAYLEKANFKKEECIIVGDQIFTDIACANTCGINSILVRPRAEKERWYIKRKRPFERLILKILNIRLENS